MADLLRRWDSLTFGKLAQPEVGYFLIWLVCHAAVVGVLIGAVVSEPQDWWRYLAIVVLIIAMTYGLYYVMLGAQWVFRAVDQWFRRQSDTGSQP